MNSDQKVTKIVKDIMNDPYNYANTVPIDQLVQTLKTLSYNYYNTGLTLVPDDIYDLLKIVLETRDPTNTFLCDIGAPINKEKVKLPSFMASLDKIKPSTDALNSWIIKYNGPYVLTDKLDGVSALFVIDNKTNKLYTRGDGIYGQDISYLIKYIISKHINIKNILSEVNLDTVMIRGELIINKENFKLIEKDMKNARNAVAGLVNSKKYNVQIAKITDFVAYSIVKPRYTQIEELKKLTRWKFNVVENRVEKKLNNDMLSNYLIDRRKNGVYEVDGIVVNDASTIYDIPNKNPEYAFAFKAIMTDQIAETIVLDVEWNISMHGYLKPKVKVEPVTLVGVTIKNATAFNAKYVVDNILGPGSKIKLIRSGDVIPHILEVLTPSASGKPKLPDVPYKWSKTNVDIIVTDLYTGSNDDMIIKKLDHFFKTMGIKYISEGIITKLVEHGYDSLIKILDADPKDLYNIDGIGAKLVDKIFNSIEKGFEKCTLDKLMAATTIFGKGFGTRKTKAIVTRYPTILKEKWTKDETINNIMEIEGFDTLTATQFSNQLDAFKKFYKELEQVVNLDHLNKKVKTNTNTKTNTNNKLEGLVVLFTGVRDKHLEELIESLGGKVTTSVSKNTSVVVYSDTSTAKYNKAVSLGIKTMTLEEFRNVYIEN